MTWAAFFWFGTILTKFVHREWTPRVVGTPRSHGARSSRCTSPRIWDWTWTRWDGEQKGSNTEGGNLIILFLWLITLTFHLYFKEDSSETPQLTLEVPSDSESSALNLDREQRQRRDGRHRRSQSRSPGQGLRYHHRSRTGRRASHAADFLSASIARSEDSFVRPKSRLRSLGDLENEVRKLKISILIV